MFNYKKFIRVILLFLTFLFTTHAYSGAAEKWEYDVTPDTNQKLNVTGHKVDAYGNAANDYQYKTKIDPKTPSARTASGTVGMGRLLKTTGWGILGVAALEALLKSVDWVIDPNAQSIWRNKPEPGGGCVGNGYLFRYQGGEQRKCPIDAVKFTLQKWSVNGATYEFVSWDKYFEGIPSMFTVSLKVGSSTQLMPNQQLDRVKDPNYVPDKEYLTPDALADYTTHTHPDFSDPNLSPKLEPKYNPQIAPDLWKPANPWEYDNSPTVQEVKKELEQANPEPKDDTIKENEPDPETGAKSFSLPAFCSWATAVCELADFIKEKYKSAEENLTEFFKNDDVDTELEFNDPTHVTSTSVSFSSQCPAPITLAQFSYHGISQNWKVDFSDWCHVLSTFLKPIVIAMASFSAVLIVSGVRENG